MYQFIWIFKVGVVDDCAIKVEDKISMECEADPQYQLVSRSWSHGPWAM